LVLTGWKLPWSVGKPEGEHLRDIAENLGVPSNIILLTENVQNTDQEAKAFQAILICVLTLTLFNQSKNILIFLILVSHHL
jgi:hypothetical protein